MMMRFIVVGGILATLSGCSSATTPGADSGAPGADAGADATVSKKCAPRSGNYTWTQELVSGNCGPASSFKFSVADSTQNFAVPYVAGERTPAGTTGSIADSFTTCTGSVIVSADNCDIEYSAKCQLPSGSDEAVGTIKWAADGESATQVEQYKTFSKGGSVTCTGDYTAKVTK